MLQFSNFFTDGENLALKSRLGLKSTPGAKVTSSSVDVVQPFTIWWNLAGNTEDTYFEGIDLSVFLFAERIKENMTSNSCIAI